MPERLRAWRNHAALNIGVAVEALVYGVVPPWFHHSTEECAYLAHGRGLAK